MACNCNKVNFELNTEYKYNKIVYDEILRDMDLRVDTYKKRKAYLEYFYKDCKEKQIYLGMDNTRNLNEELKTIDYLLKGIEKSLIPVKNKTSLNRQSYNNIEFNKVKFREYVRDYKVLNFPEEITCYSNMDK